MIEQCKLDLESAYNEYITSVSTPNMAASLELSSYLLAWCRYNKPKNIIDLGTGFSSYVFKIYAKEIMGVKFESIDDDEKWLEKSADLISSKGLVADGMGLINEFKPHASGYDLVLQDLNFVEERIQKTDLVLSIASHNGLIIFDDVHKHEYRQALLKIIEKRRYRAYNLKRVTLDNYGRFSYAVIATK